MSAPRPQIGCGGNNMENDLEKSVNLEDEQQPPTSALFLDKVSDQLETLLEDEDFAEDSDFVASSRLMGLGQPPHSQPPGGSAAPSWRSSGLRDEVARRRGSVRDMGLASNLEFSASGGASGAKSSSSGTFLQPSKSFRERKEAHLRTSALSPFAMQQQVALNRGANTLDRAPPGTPSRMEGQSGKGAGKGTGKGTGKGGKGGKGKGRGPPPGGKGNVVPTAGPPGGSFAHEETVGKAKGNYSTLDRAPPDAEEARPRLPAAPSMSSRLNLFGGLSASHVEKSTTEHADQGDGTKL